MKLASNDIPEGYGPVKSVEEINKLANAGRAVYVKRWKRHSPAAFLISMQARLLILMLEQNSLYKRL